MHLHQSQIGPANIQNKTCLIFSFWFQMIFLAHVKFIMGWIHMPIYTQIGINIHIMIKRFANIAQDIYHILTFNAKYNIICSNTVSFTLSAQQGCNKGGTAKNIIHLTSDDKITITSI